MAILWSAGHETGNMSEWYGGGGEFNSGTAASGASRDVAHTGAYSAKCTIATPPVSGVRLFRWKESRENLSCYFSAWFYFPQSYRCDWSNIFQIKSYDGRSTDPFWFLQFANRQNGNMYLTLTWWDGPIGEGPRPGQSGGRTFQQTVRDLPVGQWTHIEMFLRHSGEFDGHLTFWQDGIQLFDEPGVRTRHPDGDSQWAVSLYAGTITPSPATIYIDDAVISTTRVGAIQSQVPMPPSNLRILD